MQGFCGLFSLFVLMAKVWRLFHSFPCCFFYSEGCDCEQYILAPDCHTWLSQCVSANGCWLQNNSNHSVWEEIATTVHLSLYTKYKFLKMILKEMADIIQYFIGRNATKRPKPTAYLSLNDDQAHRFVLKSHFISLVKSCVIL